MSAPWRGVPQFNPGAISRSTTRLISRLITQGMGAIPTVTPVRELTPLFATKPESKMYSSNGARGPQQGKGYGSELNSGELFLQGVPTPRSGGN